MNPWYTDPGWYALPISLFAFGIGWRALVVRSRALREAQRGTRSDVQRGLVRQVQEMNEGFVRLGVKGPYAHHLNVPDDHVIAFSAKAAMLLNQLNLLRDVFEHRDILGGEEVDVYKDWASKILRPWIEADQNLKAVWKLSCDVEDQRNPEFNNWVRDLLPIVPTYPPFSDPGKVRPRLGC